MGGLCSQCMGEEEEHYLSTWQDPDLYKYQYYYGEAKQYTSTSQTSIDFEVKDANEQTVVLDWKGHEREFEIVLPKDCNRKPDIPIGATVKLQRVVHDSCDNDCDDLVDHELVILRYEAVTSTHIAKYIDDHLGEDYEEIPPSLEEKPSKWLFYVSFSTAQLVNALQPSETAIPAEGEAQQQPNGEQQQTAPVEGQQPADATAPPTADATVPPTDENNNKANNSTTEVAPPPPPAGPAAVKEDDVQLEEAKPETAELAASNDQVNDSKQD